MIKIEFPFVFLETINTLLVLEIKEDTYYKQLVNEKNLFVTQKYYGNKVDLSTFKPEPAYINPPGATNDYNYDFLISSSFGNGCNMESSLLFENSDGSYTNRFIFKEFNILNQPIECDGPHSRNVDQTLEIIEFDPVLKIEQHIYYSLFSDCDVISVKRKIVNLNDKPFNIKRLMSLETPFRNHNFEIQSFDGSWLYERTRHIAHLTDGVFMIDSKVGSSSNRHNPFTIVKDIENNCFFAFNLIFSGSFKACLESNSLYHSSFIIGLNDFAFSYKLESNDSFITPEAIMCFANNMDEITYNMHCFTLNHIIDPKYNGKVRPILFNSWEGTGMNISEKAILEMADVCKEVGIELFVMDDGWFKNRVDDYRALGDWVVDKNKFPSGLGELAKQIRNKNLSFGIWVEPEMISKDSDIYRSHSEYASIIPGREPLERRHQLIIDMTNPNVVDYLFDSLSKVIDEVKPAYIKWDFNRNLYDSFSTYNNKQGEYEYRFTMGSYSLMDRLIKKYPDVLFESCSSGGGRYDLGMFYYMPQAWGSDDSNSFYRSMISCGTFAGYPQSTFGAHVSRDFSPKLEEDKIASLEDRFNLQAVGCFGYEMDLRKYSEDDLDTIKKQIKYYKQHDYLFQFGKYTNCINPFDDPNHYSFILTDSNNGEAIFYISELAKDLKPISYKLKDLEEDNVYLVEEREQKNISPDKRFIQKLSGKELMESGIFVGSLSDTLDKGKFSGIKSRLFYIKKI